MPPLTPIGARISWRGIAQSVGHHPIGIGMPKPISTAHGNIFTFAHVS